MDRSKQRRISRRRVHVRVRRKVRGTAERPRLAVYRSLNHIYAQAIDDEAGRTIAAASTLDASLKGGHAGPNAAAARAVGALIAERVQQAGVKSVVFDRAGYPYHGNIKALADAAREKGLQF
ncbi:MAG TPA: 50S ribosomal protein L18 [Thermoanaerobaculia bacterium]|nr:50S ribosomal protein L18 [Thermoanaerobaculia bacterium]